MGLGDIISMGGSSFLQSGEADKLGGEFRGGLSAITDAVGLTDSKATDRALRAQREAAARGEATLKEMYDAATGRFDPYSRRGDEAFDALADMAGGYESFSSAPSPYRDHSGVFTMADFKADPGYQFRMDEGIKALERSAAARGGLGSGKTLKSIARYGQNIASDEYGKAYDRFNQDYSNAYDRYNRDMANKFNFQDAIAKYGYGAGSNLANLDQVYGGKLSDIQTGLGNVTGAAELQRGDELKQWHAQNQEMAGQALGGIGAMMCWVARAVFGKDNPKWKDARYYIKYYSPLWFRNLYLKYGEDFAKKVEKSRALRIVLRPLFEGFALAGRSKMRNELREFLWQ